MSVCRGTVGSWSLSVCRGTLDSWSLTKGTVGDSSVTRHVPSPTDPLTPRVSPSRRDYPSSTVVNHTLFDPTPEVLHPEVRGSVEQLPPTVQSVASVEVGVPVFEPRRPRRRRRADGVVGETERGRQGLDQVFRARQPLDDSSDPTDEHPTRVVGLPRTPLFVLLTSTSSSSSLSPTVRVVPSRVRAPIGPRGEEWTS